MVGTFYYRLQLNAFIILSTSICLSGGQKQQEKRFQPQWFFDRNSYLPLTLVKDRICVIVQDSAPGAEVEVLETTSRVNRAYAKRWGHDYIKFTGIALGSEPWQATFNKPYLLSSLLLARDSLNEKQTENTTEARRLQNQNHNDSNDRIIPSYDTVLFLDSSAMIVQLDYDILDLIGKDKMLAMVSDDESGGQIHNKNVYSDVMMWNLNHPQAMNVSSSWIKTSQSNLHDESVNSQTLLINVLQNETNRLNGNHHADLLDPIPELMVDGLKGTIIKQDSDYTAQVVEPSDLPNIMPVIQGIADSVCYRFYPQCDVV